MSFEQVNPLSGFQLVASNVPAEIKSDVDALGQQLVAAALEDHSLRSSGRYTETGLATLPRPTRDAAVKAVERFEHATARETKEVDAAFERIASGHLVLNDQTGRFDTVSYPEPTPVSEIRDGEIRATVRQMDARARREFVLQAFASGNTEVMRALERAPRGLGLIDEQTTEILRRERLNRSGWLPTHEQKRAAIQARTHVAAKARKVLGLPGGF